jgi:hypothetical protein
MHSLGIIGIVHHRWSNIGNEVVLHGKAVELAQKLESLVLRHSGDKLRQRLRCDAYSFDLIALSNERGFGLLQNAKRVLDLLLKIFGIQTNKRGDRPYLRVRSRRFDRMGLRRQPGGHS